MPSEIPDGVYNAARPRWTCEHCGTDHGDDLDAAARCAAAGTPDDRGPLAVLDDTLEIRTPSGAKAFTHEVLYGDTPSTQLTVAWPGINITHRAAAHVPDSHGYGEGAISEVPYRGQRRVPDGVRDEYKRPARIRIRHVENRSDADGWFGPIGADGVAVLTAAQSTLLATDRMTPAPAPTAHGGHHRSTYPFYDNDIVATSYSSRWPSAHRAVAEAICATTHPVVLNRFLHAHGDAVTAWLFDRYVTWATGGDATIPAFHTGTGCSYEKKPGLRRAAILAPVAHPERSWDRDALDEVRNDDRLASRAQTALLDAVRVDAPTLTLDDITATTEKVS